jgi:phage-related tail fiber protein
LNGGIPISSANIGSYAPTQAYVDAAIAGLSWKNSVKVATTANIALSGLQTIDGYTTVAGDRVLVKNQSTPSQNGIYIASAGSWIRSTDADSSAEIDQMAVYVKEGTTQKTTGWVLSVQ